MNNIDLDPSFVNFDYHVFQDVSQLPDRSVNREWASDPLKVEELVRFISTYHNNYQGYPEDTYQGMIDTAIKSGNFLGLITLWRGIYYHDRDNPDYESDVYTAVEFGSLKMLQHTLYGYHNYSTLNGVDSLEYRKMLELSEKNSEPEVNLFVKSLQPSTDDKGFIHFPDSDSDSDPDIYSDPDPNSYINTDPDTEPETDPDTETE